MISVFDQSLKQLFCGAGEISRLDRDALFFVRPVLVRGLQGDALKETARTE